MSSDDNPFMGRIVDPLENDAYEVDSTTSVFDAMDIIKQTRRHGVDSSNVWIKIKKPSLIELIAQTYFDSDKKRILSTISETPATIPEILDICNIPITMGYRKINSLIQTGMIIPVGYAIIQNKKKIKKYLSVIENVIIHMDKDNIVVKVKFRKNNKVH